MDLIYIVYCMICLISIRVILHDQRIDSAVFNLIESGIACLSNGGSNTHELVEIGSVTRLFIGCSSR